jgi:hypothetical protein
VSFSWCILLYIICSLLCSDGRSAAALPLSCCCGHCQCHQRPRCHLRCYGLLWWMQGAGGLVLECRGSLLQKMFVGWVKTICRGGCGTHLYFSQLQKLFTGAGHALTRPVDTITIASTISSSSLPVSSNNLLNSVSYMMSLSGFSAGWGAFSP